MSPIHRVVVRRQSFLFVLIIVVVVVALAFATARVSVRFVIAFAGGCATGAGARGRARARDRAAGDANDDAMKEFRLRKRTRDGGKEQGKDEGEERDGGRCDGGEDEEGTEARSGWLVVASARQSARQSAQSGVKMFARLCEDDTIALASERGGEVVGVIDARGCEVMLAEYPGVAEPEELRWHKGTPIVLRNAEGKGIYDGASSVWLFALSSPAKEAWFVAIRKRVERRRLEALGDDEARAALERVRVEERDFALFARATKSYREESARRDSVEGVSAGGAAGAAINALGSRLLFDMFRDERWLKEQTAKLVHKMNNAPGTPKFIGEFEITHIDYGSTVPHIISAKVPSFSSSSAPWDGASMPGRGCSHALELDVEYVGLATMTVQTRVDLSKYAQDFETSNDGAESSTSMRDDLTASLTNLKNMAAREAVKVMAQLSDTLSATPLRFTLNLKKCQGIVRLWIPPPPGDRLWWGLIAEPKIELDIVPVIGESGISHEGIGARVSRFLRDLFIADIHAQLLLPNCVAEPWKELRPFVGVTEISLREAYESATATTTSVSEQILAPALSNAPTMPKRASETREPRSSEERSVIASLDFFTTSPPPEQVMDEANDGSASASPDSLLVSSQPSVPTAIARDDVSAPPPDDSRRSREFASESSSTSFFAAAAARAKALELSVANDFRDFTSAVKDNGVAGGLKHVSKNIEKLAKDSSRLNRDD